MFHLERFSYNDIHSLIKCQFLVCSTNLYCKPDFLDFVDRFPKRFHPIKKNKSCRRKNVSINRQNDLNILSLNYYVVSIIYL